MASLVQKLLTEVSPPVERGHAKVSVVGVGQVGMAAAFSMITQATISELALVDVMEDKLKGEMMDLQHGQAFTRNIKVVASTDYAVTAGSKICIVTAGVRQKEGESRLNLVHRNVQIYKGIIPQLVKYSPDCIIVVVSNPVDLMTYVTWKLSGLPHHRVIGSGTMLDSSRFRFLLSEKLQVAPSAIHAYIIGEHGDSSVAVWSSVNVGGVRFQEIHPEVGTAGDTEDWAGVHRDVINSAYEIIKLKGYTSWAIGLMVSTLVNAIMKNTKQMYSLSTNVKGYHGIKDDVFLSIPCVVGEGGISHVVVQKLCEDEQKQFNHSAETLGALVKELQL